MPTSELYGSIEQHRVPVNNGAWNAIVLSRGMKHSLLSMDDINATFVLSFDNGVPLAAGRAVAAGRSVQLPGTESADLTIYVNPSINTTAQVLYQADA